MKVKVRKREKRKDIPECSIFVPINEQTLTRIICESNRLIKEEQEKEKAEALQLRKEKQKDILGEKDYSYIKSKFRKKILTSINQVKCNWKMLNLSRDEAEYFSTISALAKMLTNALLSLIQLALYFICIVFVFVSFFASILFFHCILIAFLFFILARFVRIAKIEVENMEDDGYLLNVSMMVIAVVTLFAPVVWKLVCTIISCINTGGI